MKIQLSRIAFALLLLVSLVQAQSPAAQTETSTGGDSSKPDYSKEAFVIERLYVRYRFENDGTGQKTTTLRVHVLSEAGVQAFGQLRFGYNSANERLDIAYVRVIQSDASVVTAGPEVVQDSHPW